MTTTREGKSRRIKLTRVAVWENKYGGINLGCTDHGLSFIVQLHGAAERKVRAALADGESPTCPA